MAIKDSVASCCSLTRCSIPTFFNAFKILRTFGSSPQQSGGWPTLLEPPAGPLHAVLLTYFSHRCDVEQKN